MAGALAEIDLASFDVEVTAVRRRNVRTMTPAADMRVEVGDVLVLLGAEDDFAAAEMKLVQG
ncbi:MAG: TrkA C-terminal domain-containing protein [Sulfuricaulis sp.]|uniref:TrkA C-terminal domain-containing protein n=1 Tax=Sulfuricaulis sp. TaxID=2003553 RepID=UPI0034A1978D